MAFKKILALISALILLLPFSASATIAVPWQATSTDKGNISPGLVNGNSDGIKIGPGVGAMIGTNEQIINNQNGAAGISVKNSSSGNEGGFFAGASGDVSIGAVSNSALKFQTNNSEVGRFSATGLFGVGSTSPGSLLSIGNSGWNFYDNATSTKNGTGGVNITNGCFAVNGVCISGSGGGISSVTGTYPVISSGGSTPAISLAFGTTTSNTWAGTQTFTNPIVDGTLSGLIGANTGLTYTVATGTVANGTGISVTAGQSVIGSGLTITNTGVISLGNGTGTTCSGTNPGTCNINTTQNITVLSNLTTNGFVQTTGGTGTLTSAALTSGQVTTALGFTPFGGTNPLPIANGGTNATSFTTTGNGVYYDGTRLLTAPTASAVTYPYASSTAISSSYASSTNAFYGTLNLPSITGTQCLHSISGVVSGTGADCGVGGTNYWTSSAGTTYLNTNLIAGFPTFNATSTTATSTIMRALQIGSGLTGTLDPYLLISTTTPAYGYLAGDLTDIGGNDNRYFADNTFNNAIGNCAQSGFIANDNNPAINTGFGNLMTTNDGWTGVGCTLQSPVNVNPESTYISNWGWDLDFSISTTTNSVAGKPVGFKWLTGGGATQAMTLTNQGLLGVGTTSPHALVSANAASSSPTENLLELSYSGGAGNGATTTIFTAASSTGTDVHIATTTGISGNVLTVNGGVYLHGLATGAGNGTVCITTDGQLQFDSAANCVLSGLQFKNVDATITPEDSLSTVMKLSPIYFHYKQGFSDGGTKQWEGFGAQDVALVDTDLVQYDASGTPISVYYQNITAKLVGAIQAIVERLDGQQAEIDALKAQNATMQKEIEVLQANQQHYVKVPN